MANEDKNKKPVQEAVQPLYESSTCTNPTMTEFLQEMAKASEKQNTDKK